MRALISTPSAMLTRLGCPRNRRLRRECGQNREQACHTVERRHADGWLLTLGTVGEARDDALREAGNVMAGHEPDEPVDLPEATVTPQDVFAWRAEGHRRAPKVAQELGLSPDEVLKAFDATVFPEGQGTVSSDATVVISYERTYAGLPVVGGSFVVHMTRSGEIRWISRNAVPIRVPTTRPTVARRSAMDAAVASTQLKGPQPRASELVVFIPSEDSPVLAWRIVIVGRGPGGGEEVLTDAGTGTVVGRAPTGLTFDLASPRYSPRS